MYYLYQLLFDDVVFYIGISNNPVKRYAQHCNSGSATGCIIREYIQRTGNTPNLKILAHFDNAEDAAIFESALIIKHSEINHKLSNYECNSVDNIMICSKLVSRKEIVVNRAYLRKIELYFNYYIDNNGEDILKTANDFIADVKPYIPDPDYKQAKEIGITLAVGSEVVIEVQKTSTFRKYIRDFSHGKKLVTKIVDGKLRITRVS